MFQNLSYHKPKSSNKRSYTNLSKDTDWIVIRKKMMNKWMCKPDWCCLKIRRFLGSIQYSSIEKLKIVSSYFYMSGFRSGAIDYPCVVRLKQEVFNEIKSRKNKGSCK
jgi:hypothetical protein